MGAAWGIVFVGMLATLLVVLVVRMRRSGSTSTRMIVIGVAIGLAVAGLAFLSLQTR